MPGLRLLAVLLLAQALLACAPNLAPVDHRGPEIRGSRYTVARGDTLYSIAWRSGVDYRTLARWNHIDPPYVIYPGQRLRLTGPASRPEPSRPPSSPAPAASKPKPARPVPSGPAAEVSWGWPTRGELLRRFSSAAQGKQGIEIAGAGGQPIVAAAPGRVVYAGSGLRGYGNLVIVKHNSRYLTAYGYNRSLLVREGDSVAAGQQIATMGVGNGQRPSLHFELRRDGKPVDPLGYLPAK